MAFRQRVIARVRRAGIAARERAPAVRQASRRALVTAGKATGRASVAAGTQGWKGAKATGRFIDRATQPPPELPKPKSKKKMGALAQFLEPPKPRRRKTRRKIPVSRKKRAAAQSSTRRAQTITIRIS